MNPQDLADEPQLRDYSGQVIAGRYRVDSLLGRGGMGCVYRAQHVELDEPVVVKFIDPAYARDPRARTRFRREAKALMRLRHPGIVTMHEFGQHDGTLFLVMELVEGVTLGARLASPSGPLTLAAIHDIFRQLGDVLEATHAAGVIHRDLKPDNVMLVPGRASSAGVSTRVILMDFGLARLDETKEVGVSTTGGAIGTPSYMSPEQCYGSGTAAPSDIYSLGVMLFQSLSGRRPFDSETAAVVMSQHMFVAPAKLERMASGQMVPVGLGKLVEDMLGKKPETRPTATQFLQRLEGVRTGSDPLSFGAAAVDRRLADVMKTRAERALPGASTLPFARESGLAAEPTMLAPEAAQPLVWVQGFESERASRLIASLAVNGIKTMGRDTFARLSSATQDGALSVIILPGTTPAAETVRTLRQTPEYATVPVLVIDVREASEIAELIRAGASDVALSLLGDDVVVTKTWRLIRRRR